jgi:hypothetical protein
VHRGAGAPVDLGGVEVGVGLLEQQLAQRPVVERRERPRQRPRERPLRGVHDEPVERLLDRAAEIEVLEPRGRGGARRRLLLADLVAVDDQDRATGACKLSCNREPCKGTTADEDVRVAVQRGALGTSLGRPDRHCA